MSMASQAVWEKDPDTDCDELLKSQIVCSCSCLFLSGLGGALCPAIRPKIIMLWAMLVSDFV